MPKISDEEYALEQKIKNQKKRVKLLRRNLFDNVCITFILFSFFMILRLVCIWKMSFLQYLVFFDSLWLSTYACTTIHYFLNKKKWGDMPIEMYSATVRTL